MKSSQKCYHCGAPIQIQKINTRFYTCEYCDSEIIISEELFKEATLYQQIKKAEIMKLESQLNKIKKEENEKIKTKNNKKAFRQFLGILTIFFGGGCFGIPSFICGRKGLGILSIIIMFICAETDVAFGFISVLLMFIIPIISILFPKIK